MYSAPPPNVKPLASKSSPTLINGESQLSQSILKSCVDASPAPAEQAVEQQIRCGREAGAACDGDDVGGRRRRFGEDIVKEVFLAVLTEVTPERPVGKEPITKEGAIS